MVTKQVAERPRQLFPGVPADAVPVVGIKPVNNGLLGKTCHQVVVFKVIHKALPVRDPEMAGDEHVPIQTQETFHAGDVRFEVPIREERVTDPRDNGIHHEQDLALRKPGSDVAVTMGRAGIEQLEIDPIDLIRFALAVPGLRCRGLAVGLSCRDHVGAQFVGDDIRIRRQVRGIAGMVKVIVGIDDGVNGFPGKYPANGPGVGPGSAGRGQGIECNNAFVSFQEYGAVNAFTDGPDFIAYRTVGNIPPGPHDGVGRRDGKNTAMVTFRVTCAVIAVFLFAHINVCCIADVSWLCASRPFCVPLRGHRG